jgi:phage recombination protein Bet
MASQELTLTSDRPSLSALFAAKYAVQQNNVFALLKETALKSKDAVSDAEVAAFMIVCNQYELNPFIKEIYGFISNGKMQYVISVDGWATLVNRQSSLNGIEFEEHFDGATIKAITCRIHHKNRALPTVVTEYLSECKRDTVPWKTWPIRMLRHKAMIQCSRIAFGLAGIMDEDEAERMEGGGFGPTLIEGTTRATPEIEEAMDKLGWNDTKKRMARANFRDNEKGFMEHLAAEIGKLGSAPPQGDTQPKAQRGARKPAATVDAQPATEAQPEAAAQQGEAAQEDVDAQPTGNAQPVNSNLW